MSRKTSKSITIPSIDPAKIPASLEPPLFQGVFDDQMREIFHAKRLAVGFSLQQLGEFLKIHWSTIRKWEAGITTSCHPRHIKRINKFLAGEYDDQLHSLSRQEIFPKASPARKVPLVVDQCLERASQAYQLCQNDYPELGTAFLESIDQAIQDTIRRFLERLGGSSCNTEKK